MKGELRRDDDAVSAAVATVLLFGGVISIIGMMLLSMMPVIQELEGSVKRHDMEAQLTSFGHEVTILSESGMPGDKTEYELIPVDGEMRWDRVRGGMWYSASWYEDNSFRIRDALTLDNNMEIRHPEGHVQAICTEDMRLGPDRDFIYTPYSNADSYIITPAHGLAIPLGPVEISQGEDVFSLKVGEVLVIDSDEEFSSSHELTGFAIQGDGGVSIHPPSKAEPATGEGRHWAIPLATGTTTIHMLAEDDLMVQWAMEGDSGTQVEVHPTTLHSANYWTRTFTATEDTLLEVFSDSDARLMVMFSDEGRTAWPGSDGSMLSKRFIPPFVDGKLVLSNPSDNSATITWRNGGTSVPAYSTIEVDWPAAGLVDAAIIESSQAVMLSWASGTNGLDLLGASDTGRLSGSEFFLEEGSVNEVQLSGMETSWNMSSANGTLDTDAPSTTITPASDDTLTSTDGDALTVIRDDGDSGLLSLRHDGSPRCIMVDTTASGWIEVQLPWANLNGLLEGGIIAAWKSGAHPASIGIDLIGNIGDSSHSTIATAWAFHLSRFTYEFDSSISGLEVAWSAGAVVTNHPELKPLILQGPTDRGGPGPRFSATIPSMHPTSNSVSGAGVMNLNLELTNRESLASTTAYEVRRGWAGPYGDAIASWSSQDLEASEDWIVTPGRMDLLDDYTGWVPIPSHGPSEAVWHTGGLPIQFNLQISSIEAHVTEARI